MSDSNVITKGSLQKVLQRFNEDLGQYINTDQRYKLGRVLTIIDASIADAEQRKAIKDLVQNEWWSNTSPQIGENPMLSPHTDLRAICEVFGFELYESNAGSLPTAGSDMDFSVDRYTKIAKED